MNPAELGYGTRRLWDAGSPVTISNGLAMPLLSPSKSLKYGFFDGHRTKLSEDSMQIIVINGQAVTFSWVSGVVVRKDDALLEEARKNFDAVINRLLREGKEDEAEEIFLILAGRSPT